MDIIFSLKKLKKSFLSVSILTLLLVCISNTIVYADTDDYCSGSWKNSSSLTIQWYDTICDSFKSTSIGFWWNGYTDNVNIGSQSIGQSTNQGCDIRIKGSSSISSWASTQNYIKVLGVSIPSWSQNWSHSIVTVNTSSYLMDKSIYLQKKVIVHEIGHALGLDHPAPDNSHTDIKAIMKQGDNGYYTIQSHDGDNLRAKYN